MKSTMKKSVVGACIAALSPIGLLASSPLAHGIPNIPLDIPDVPPACDPAQQNCDVPPASILLPTSKWTCQRDRAFRLIP